MSKYYPYGIFCNKYGCWCDDVVDITDGCNECNGDCANCDYSSKPDKSQFTFQGLSDRGEALGHV